jgi:hypothetical protein
LIITQKSSFILGRYFRAGTFPAVQPAAEELAAHEESRVNGAASHQVVQNHPEEWQEQDCANPERLMPNRTPTAKQADNGDEIQHKDNCSQQ